MTNQLAQYIKITLTLMYTTNNNINKCTKN